MKHYILKIEAYDGDSTRVELFNEDEVVKNLFYVIEVSNNGAWVVDCGYRSIEEAKEAWPNAQSVTDPSS